MARLINKKDCSFVSGHVVYEGETVALPADVSLLMMRLETMVQQWLYLKKQAPYSPGPSLDGWEFQHSEAPASFKYHEEAETPAADAAVAKAMDIMAEIDNAYEIEKMNEVIDKFAPLFKFAEEDCFFEGMFPGAVDCVHLGNPLDLKPETIKDYIKAIANSPVQMMV